MKEGKQRAAERKRETDGTDSVGGSRQSGAGGRKKISKVASLENKIDFPITGYLLAQVAR